MSSFQRLVIHMLCWATRTRDGSMTWREERSRAARVTHTEEALTSTGALRLTSLLRTSSTCSLEVASPPVSEPCVCRLTDEFTWVYIIHHFFLKFKIYWFYSYVLVMSRVVSLLVSDLVSHFRWSDYVRIITKLSWLFFNLKILRLESHNWLLLVQSVPYIMY